jgi:hypothetical protein
MNALGGRSSVCLGYTDYFLTGIPDSTHARSDTGMPSSIARIAVVTSGGGIASMRRT